MKKKIVWFAKGGGIAKSGPYKTQVEATNAMRLAKQVIVQNDGRTVQKFFPDDVFIWPEEVDNG